MKAVVFHGVGDIRLDEVPEPRVQERTDAIVRITASALCGTDLHLVRGTVPGMKAGTILGHEGIGLVEEVGLDVRNLQEGERVIVPSTIACGWCVYCRAGYFAQCDTANPNGPRAGTAFFGGPESSGPFQGLQAERARIPHASAGLVKVPEDVADEEAILLSDIFPTAYFAAELAEVRAGDTVAVFGCGPVGQLAITSARLLGAGRILAVDTVPERLEMARAQGAEVVDFNAEDPVATILELTGGIGVDRVIEAVGVDASRPRGGPASPEADRQAQRFRQEVEQVAPDARPRGDQWHPGDAPSQALEWALQAVAKAGTLAIVGVYPPTLRSFPIGAVTNKNLTVNTGNCHHRRYIPKLLDLVRSGTVEPSAILTHVEPMTAVLDAYRAFDTRQPGWIKVELVVGPDEPTAPPHRAVA